MKLIKAQNKTITANDSSAIHRAVQFVMGKLSKNTTVASALVLLQIASSVEAASFSFSTGDPDGKIATLSRPSSPGKMQTETADDFFPTESVVLNEATFTGLLPLGTALTSISNVEIEIYHLFPGDTAFPLSGNVPTRTNSPADVEIDSATRDSANGSITFSATIVNASFTASNSVVNGINKSPAQRTNGEGEVTGEEVLITVHFNPPIALPADHYFFRPEVLLDRGDFLWLSAPRPIVAPGTPFGTDLQSWIRNDALAPDWLRIGTDITGQGPFNAAFSLSGETDADEDGVADSLDQCPNTAPGAIVDAQGCSIDQIAPCRGPASGGTWKNHGEYVSSVAQAAEAFLAQGLISADQAEEIIAQAAQSTCGKNR
ncbi:MAG TPA: thrombospondin type 3 repeat-containing protein [Candidatus Limnocylindrales bacterium]|nr:thrombospondin type 3 repeat-containing protein [Candidatus Limnocylindrales bacterium]